MTTTNTQSAAGRRRIKTLVLTLLLLAVGISLAFNYYRHWSKPLPRAQGRSLQDFMVTWRCESCGRQLDDRGAQGTRPCPDCGNPMYVSIAHACPRHGAFPVLYLYDEHGKHGDPTRIKVADGAWVAYLDENYNHNIRCPRCGHELMPAERPRPAAP